MRHLLIISLIGFFLFACEQKNTAPVPSDLADYEITDIPGTSVQKVVKRYVDGKIIEEGQLLNGLRTGAWTTFSVSEPFPEKIITYANGMANGPYFEFNERGQVEVQAFYKDNQLDGTWGQYKFGRPVKEATYKDGKLNGVYREYTAGGGKIQKEIEYKDGQMHGRYLFYDDDGNVVLDYQYNNGEKVE